MRLDSPSVPPRVLRAERGLFGIELLAPKTAGTWGDASTAWLVGVSALTALAATAVMHLLLVATPQPFAFFGWIMGLLTVAAALWPYATEADLAAKIATSAIFLAIGIAIGSLVRGAGARSIRRGRPTAGTVEL